MPRLFARRPLSGLAALLVSALLSGAALASPTATELFFDTPYLSRVPAGTTLDYIYKHVTARPDLGESFDETLAMKVDAAPDDAAGRIANVVIHRGDKEGEAGPFPTRNGNPISLVLLERDVKEIALLTKGSPFYLRNRLRDHLAGGTVEPARFSFEGHEVEGWKLTMSPFAQDPNKDKLLELVDRRYEFIYSEAVPGGLYAIRVITPAKDGAANLIDTSLTLTGASAPTATK
ncbi:hypothetical protein FHS55_000791 [Angulomicrobium tetraedrale]|uniref:DUF3108 domain-containing protein n=1 Tax=Ancylobacter tetraedralis TaxID=217068 RepID=A0A839Z7V7_9HYPH|nr:hypothetical protein [Ancylobacter tetraedralis]MBB3770205.1 hypothetical protein [Ancylobacter tetraedralis]